MKQKENFIKLLIMLYKKKLKEFLKKLLFLENTKVQILNRKIFIKINQFLFYVQFQNLMKTHVNYLVSILEL